MKKIILEASVISEIIRLYSEEMLGSSTISDKLNIPKHVILKTLHGNNITIRPSGRIFIGGKSASDKRYYEKNKEKISKYYVNWKKENYDDWCKYYKTYLIDNADKIRENKRKYQKKLKDNSPRYKLICNFKCAMYTVLREKNIKKRDHYFNILGYTQEELISHLENLFTDGMSWDNYGKWHVDHKLPISHFDFITTNDDGFKNCWTLSNLQPMWASDNIKKSNKIIL